MVGITGAGFAAGAAADNARRYAPPFEPAWRPFVPSFLWGRLVEYCAECGGEVEPGAAYRVSGRQVYCSVTHAQRDLDG
ncbi:hypothetical protein M4I32_12815 [Microbacterium sp. LRZ72]|uniref:hypothetical protein n=1 Tax=Microbacterium sp. LRZ72 TaxID=2942481 RepID=UPI0029A9E40E|nr:hypothetical protein [Microbacterium sp. LRZ72]MDX2377684.1 hypothetical protein [Microbacterium sp. LRZ72]